MKKVSKLIGHDLKGMLGVLQVSAEDLEFELNDQNIKLCKDILQQIRKDILVCVELSKEAYREVKGLA